MHAYHAAFMPYGEGPGVASRPFTELAMIGGSCDGDSHRRSVGAASTVANGVGEAVGAFESVRWCVPEVVVLCAVLDRPMSGLGETDDGQRVIIPVRVVVERGDRARCILCHRERIIHSHWCGIQIQPDDHGIVVGRAVRVWLIECFLLWWLETGIVINYIRLI